MNPAVERFVDVPVVRRAALAVAILSIAALLLQGFAEQGGIGSALSPVPEQPLPFPRERIFGVDLSDRPSLEAIEWLEASGSSPFALVLIRVDADIVAALRDPQSASDAFRALDQLMAVSSETTVALCLERPVTEIEDTLLAELTIDALRDRYPDRIAYVTTCHPDVADEWQTAIADQVRSSSPASPNRLLPLSTGASVETRQVISFDDLGASRLRQFAGDRYVLPIVRAAAPPSDAQVLTAMQAIRDAAQIGLILIQPDGDGDPHGFADSLSAGSLPQDQLPEGFTSIASDALAFDERWSSSTVGLVEYMRTEDAGASLQTAFSGTTIYLHALLSPNSGTVAVWIDPDPADPGPPDQEIDLSADQARDAAIVLAQGEDAERHTIALVTTGGNIAISGLFVSGQPASGWNAGVTALALIAIATAALAVVGLARVQDIRRRTALPASQSAEQAHPRAYHRDA